MADWVTISSLGTAGGTLVLAVATFAAVRSSNRAARATERALLASIRPVLAPSRDADPPVKVGYVDNHWVYVPGGRAVCEVTDDAVYVTVSLRNVGSGLAVLDRYEIVPDRLPGELSPDAVASFRRLQRDIYIPAGDNGFWQAALRDRDDPTFAAVAGCIAERRPFTVDLLYGDSEGGQRTVSRFAIAPIRDAEWLPSVGRHWHLDGRAPR